MYVTVRSYSGNSDLVDALIDRESEVRDLITGIDGFQAYYLVRTTDGEAMSISVYDDERGGDESSRQARDFIAENLPDLHVGPPRVDAGEAVLTI